MKKFITLILLLFIGNTSYWYELPSKNQKLLDNIKLKVLKIYNKDPNKAYILTDRIEKLLPDYKNNIVIFYSLNYILKFSIDFITSYESSIVKNINTQTASLESSTWSTNDIFVAQIDKDLLIQIDNLNTLTIGNLQTISSFNIEPKNDHLYLKNIYLHNSWSINDINWLFVDVYLVNSDNKLVSKWYIINNYFYFDISDYIIKKDVLEKFSIKALVNIPNNINQTWELVLEFSTPSNALNNTINGIRATSYSNWSFVNSNVSISDPIKTLITKTTSSINSNNFISSYKDAIGFNVSNNSNDKLVLVSFKFSIYWSFLNSITNDSEFVLKKKWTNIIFGSWTKADIFNNSLVIPHNWDDFDYISQNTSSDYVLEINHIWTPEWNREIRLDNIVVWDWFWWIVNNLNDYNNFWLPTNYIIYRY